MSAGRRARSRSRFAIMLAIAASLIASGCSKPPDHLSAELVEELLGARLADPARVAAIVSQRTGASMRSGDRRDLGDERQQGLLGIDRFALSGSAGSWSQSGAVLAGWVWVSREESWLPENNSARAAAVWIATSIAAEGENRDAPPFDVNGLAKAVATLQIPDGQKWTTGLLGDPGNPTLFLETVPADTITAGGPVPWVLLAFRAETPAGRAALARLAAGARLELAERPALFAFRSGASAFLWPAPSPRPTIGIAEALPPPPSMTPHVGDAVVTYEEYDDIPRSVVEPERRVIPRRRRLVRVLFNREERIVGLSAEVVQDDPAEYFIGGWYKSNEKDLLRQWKTFLANHTRKGTSASDIEPLRCAWPGFLPRPWWFEEPAELPVHVGTSAVYSAPLWGAGGATPGRGIRYAWFGLDEEGTIRYCVHQTEDARREYRWVLGELPGFEVKKYSGWPRPSRVALPEQGRDWVTFYDGQVEFEATMQLRVSPVGNPLLYGPLFIEEVDPIALRVLPASKGESRRPWGELPR